MKADEDMDAHGAFMRSTGFDVTNRVPTMSDVSRPSGTGGVNDVVSQHMMAQPNPAQRVPSTAEPAPLKRGLDTPNKGLVPGMMPTQSQIGDMTRQSMPYPRDDLYAKTSYVKDKNEGVKRTDWRATDVGPRTDRTSPGKVATSMKDQGKLDIPLIGIEPRSTTGGMGKGQYLNQNAVNSNIKGSTPRKERFSAIDDVLCDHYMTLGIISVFGAIASAIIYGKSQHAMGFSITFYVSLLLSGLFFWRDHACRRAKKENQEGQSGIRKAYEFEKNDLSKQQVYQPLNRGQRDPNPYPKKPDTQTSQAVRLAAQGTDPNVLEGPRANYEYQYGPEPPSSLKITKNDFMRDPGMYNFDDAGLEEYMRRLQGEYPDQQHQRYPYHPFAASWEYRQQIDDSNRMLGITDSPSTFNRKFVYREPRIQQAGAKTMHLKAPPPEGYDVLEKTHPWMEEPDANMAPVDIDDYYQRGQFGGGSEYQTAMTNGIVTNAQRYVNEDGIPYTFASPPQLNYHQKLDENAAARVVAERQAETEMLQNLFGPSKTAMARKEMQAVPTSSDSIRKQYERDQQDQTKSIRDVQDRALSFYPQAIGYGFEGVPPHPQQSPPVPPTSYGDDPRARPYNAGPADPRHLASPALRRDAPPMPQPRKTMKQKSDEFFGNLFSEKQQPSDMEVNNAMQESGRR